MSTPTPRVWHCGMGHSFVFGDEVWHYDINQGMIDGSPIPMYCTHEDDGEPCMDSSSLYYD